MNRNKHPRLRPGVVSFTTVTMSVVAFVALIAASASYQHQYELAIRHGQTHWVAGLLPFSVDGMIVSATLVLWYAARHGFPRPWGAWLVLMAGVTATAIANLAADSREGWGWLGPAISVWPAVAFVAAYEMAVWLVRKRQGAASSPVHPETTPPGPSRKPQQDRPAGEVRDTGPAPGRQRGGRRVPAERLEQEAQYLDHLLQQGTLPRREEMVAVLDGSERSADRVRQQYRAAGNGHGGHR
jgi:hypothetical protein